MFYDVFVLETWKLFGVLLAVSFLSVEAGHRCGLWLGASYDQASMDQMGSLEAGILGTVGLILGFAFSVSLSRFDDRRELVVHEANAIGTVYLRCQLLPSPERERCGPLLVDYADLRVKTFEQRKLRAHQAEHTLHKVEQLQTELWALATSASRADSRPVLNLFVSALNELIDLHTSRVAALRSHVPRMVTWVVFLFVTLGLGTAVFASSARCRRRLGMWYALATLLAALLLLIIELDRPVFGAIPVDHAAMYYQRGTMR